MSKHTWIIDAGHGGIDPKTGKYTTGNKKRYKFPDGYEVLEGVINRSIASKLIAKLQAAGIQFTKAYDDVQDLELLKRVRIAAFVPSPKIYLSIHSNSNSATISGPGTSATGFEVYTSKGETQSDAIAETLVEVYEEAFPQYPMRKDTTDGDSDKEADFTVLKLTPCPAVLVENLFFDNREEAEYLSSAEGSEAIASALFEFIQRIEEQ